MNSYIEEVLGYRTQHSTETVLWELWKLSESMEMAQAITEGDPPVVMPASSSSFSSSSPASPHPSDNIVLLDFITQLSEIEHSPITAGGRDARYRFLATKYESRLPASLKTLISTLVPSVMATDKIIAAGVKEVTAGYRRKLPSLTKDINQLSEHKATLDAVVHGLNDCGDENLYNASARLLKRCAEKNKLGVLTLRLCCGLVKQDMDIVASTCKGISNLHLPPTDSGFTATIISNAADVTKTWDNISKIQLVIDETVQTCTDIVELRETRDRCLNELESLGVMELKIHDMTQILTTTIDRLTRGEEARISLKSALRSGNIDTVRTAIANAESVGMKDTDGTLHHAEVYLQETQEIHEIVSNLNVTSGTSTEHLLQAIVVANKYLMTTGLYIERAPVYDTNGKVIPPTTDECDMYLDHYNNKMWTGECTVVYQEACIQYGQRRTAASLSCEVKDLMDLPDDDFVRAAQLDDFFAELTAKMDDNAYHAPDRNHLQKRLNTLLRTRVKIFYPQGDIKVITVPQKIDFKQLHQTMVSQYLEDNPELDEVAFKVSYLDSDEDRIRITTNRDWEECVMIKRTQLPSTLGSTTMTFRPGDVKIDLYLDYNFNAVVSETTVVRKSEATVVKKPTTTVVKREAPSQVQAQAPSQVQAQAPSQVQAQAPSQVQAQAPSQVRAQAPSHAQPLPPPSPPSERAVVVNKWGPAQPLTLLPEVPDTSFIVPKPSTAIEDSVHGVGLPLKSMLYPDLEIREEDDEPPRVSNWDRFKENLRNSKVRAPQRSNSGLQNSRKQTKGSAIRASDVYPRGKPRQGGLTVTGNGVRY
eukprot:TRINITY_DN1434_c0_g1_i1.p1 TRINITY_DN1434_c0_g1~~TRINITY_DN1434_c0_g1_i1.p1  ORF type:complete len:817 (+),score=147.41 TRINITY_DN1434_c0_g1_i1:51-2501(+)